MVNGGPSQRAPLPPFLQQRHQQQHQFQQQQQQQPFRNTSSGFPNGSSFPGSGSSHSNNEFDFPTSFQPPSSHDDPSAQVPHDLLDAFSNFDLEDTTRAALASRLQANGKQDGFAARQGQGYASGGSRDGRDPNSFLFSPFSPSDSPLVGGKDLPNSHSQASSLHLTHRAEDGEESHS